MRKKDKQYNGSMKKKLKGSDLLNQNRNTPQPILNSLWFILGGLLVYLVLEIVIHWPSVNRFDREFLVSLDPLRVGWMIPLMRHVTQLGSANFLLPLIFAITLFLLIKKRFIAALLLPSMFFLESWLNDFLKNQVMRDRPDLTHLVHATGYSFPSGHAMNAATTYGLIILLLLPHLHKKWMKRLCLATGILTILLVGFSRPYLRVHFLTDILAGYAVGAVLIGFSMIILYLADAG